MEQRGSGRSIAQAAIGGILDERRVQQLAQIDFADPGIRLRELLDRVGELIRPGEWQRSQDFAGVEIIGGSAARSNKGCSPRASRPSVSGGPPAMPP